METSLRSRSVIDQAMGVLIGQAGITPEDVHVTGSYDAFTFTTMLQLEDYGFCKKGEGGEEVRPGRVHGGRSRCDGVDQSRSARHGGHAR